MKHIDTCDICQQKAKGKRYDFYYGLFLGNTDVYIGGPGTVGNHWTEHYRILGQSGSFICQRCISREFWKRVFSEPRLDELEVRWFDLFLFFLGFAIVSVLFGGLFKIAQLVGLNITISESFSNTFLILYLVVVTAIVLLTMKITTYMLDFGNEMAYRIKYKELPRVPKLICIPPSKYNLLKQPGAGQRKGTETAVNITSGKQATSSRQVARSESKNICAKCGNVGQPRDRYCRKCGNPLI